MSRRCAEVKGAAEGRKTRLAVIKVGEGIRMRHGRHGCSLPRALEAAGGASAEYGRLGGRDSDISRV